MGVLTDFVVAKRTDARKVGRSACPCEEFDGIDAKGIDTVKLGTLDAILTGAEYDTGFMNETLYSGRGGEGPWVFEVPPALVSRLAELPETELMRVGIAWAATEEFSPEYDNWPAEAVHQMLEQLVALARRAVDARKSLLMWMCL